MQGKMYRAKVIAECEQSVLKIVKLKIKYPLWHDVDKWLDDLARALRSMKKWWR